MLDKLAARHRTKLCKTLVLTPLPSRGEVRDVKQPALLWNGPCGKIHLHVGQSQERLRNAVNFLLIQLLPKLAQDDVINQLVLPEAVHFAGRAPPG